MLHTGRHGPAYYLAADDLILKPSPLLMPPVPRGIWRKLRERRCPVGATSPMARGMWFRDLALFTPLVVVLVVLFLLFLLQAPSLCALPPALLISHRSRRDAATTRDIW